MRGGFCDNWGGSGATSSDDGGWMRLNGVVGADVRALVESI